MNAIIKRSLWIVACVVCGCGGADSTASIAGGNPTGKIGDQSWTMTTSTVTNDGSTLSVTMFGDAEPACAAGAAGNKGYLLFEMPAQVGERPLHLDLSSLTDPSNQTLTFVVPPASNDIATNGRLSVANLTSTSVTIGVVADAANGDEVNGTFTATLCP
jgi:hypothetical protein